jgi:hypothetical protein
MAFVLLLILSITSFVVVEQQSANIAKQQLVAKQNALVGLQIAIGELQQRLGPDQRATASADILDGSNNPYTLVWHSDPAKGWDSATKDWIPGGDSDFALPLLSVDPAKLSTLISSDGEFNESVLDNPVELMAISKPSNGTLTSLKAERRPLIDAQGATTGNYAWVAQDESLKANLKSAHGDYQNADPNLDLVETSRRLSVFPYANAAGVEIEGELPFDAIDPVADNGELNDDYFEKIQKAEDLSDLIASGILDPADESGSKAKQLAPYRNHFTLNSKGVLADTKNGGLRRDLSRGLDDQYFEKLHTLPVFGVDRDGNVVADGINEPVGDQWKFFRDYYNFYRPVDNGLADAVSPVNELFGLDNVTNNEPSTRMRFTNQVVARDVVHLFRQRGSRSNYARAWARPYESSITPDILTKLKYRSDNNLNFNISKNDWNLFTPQIRPVVIRNSLKISIKPVLYTSTNTSDPNNGKYYLEFRVYPTITLWNPFNVAIEFNNSLSDNPLANGYQMYLFQTGTMNVEIGVLDSGNNMSIKEYKLGSISPNVALINEDSLSAELGRTSMPPGAVMICGLTQNYYADRNGSNPQYSTSPNGGQSSGFIELGLGTQINEDYHVTYRDDDARDNQGRIIWDRIYYNEDDILTLYPLRSGTGNDTYRWLGQIDSKKGTGAGIKFDSFYQGENANMDATSSTTTTLGTVLNLVNQDPFPTNAIDIRARTIGDEPGNPAFPVFAQMNLMGTYPQVVDGSSSGDVNGDVRILYISNLMENVQSDPMSGRRSDGFASYGTSLESGRGESKILLYDLPRHPIVSIGDFKNLVFSWNEDTSPRPIGASWPSGTISDLEKTFVPVGRGSSAHSKGAGCDTSYHYNDTLFDSYFLSGIPPEDRDENVTFPYQQTLTDPYIAQGSPIANTQLVYYKEPTATEIREKTVSQSGVEADAFEAAASHLLIDTPFNVNSTSSIAWQAVLSGFRNQSIEGINSDKSKRYTGKGSPYIDHFVPSGEADELYVGHRRLSDEDLRDLSENIVAEIRGRKVAKSLGSFINRDPTGTGINLEMSRIDEAIINAGINSSSETIAKSGESDVYALDSPGYKPAAHMFGNALVEETGAGLPGYFKQQDILRPLAPIMTTRGDTFIIRAYGESIDPITQKVTGRAWCEITLQRTPDYLNNETPAWTFPPTDAINSKFGRSFSIKNFRWLNDENISS